MDNLLKILLYSILFLIPLGVISRINVFNDVYIQLTDPILFIILLTTIFLSIKKRINPFKLPFVRHLYPFIIFGFISLLLNLYNLQVITFSVSFLYLFRFILYVNLIYAFNLLDKKFINKYLFFISVSGFVFVIFGFIQYFYYPDLRNLYYIGWDEHLYRMFSTFLDPNFAGAFFILELILVLSLFQNQREKISLANIFYYLAVIIVTIIAIFLTYSRSTYIMFLISLLVYFLLTNQKKILTFTFILFFIGIILLPKNLQGEGVNLLRTASINARIDDFNNSLIIFKDNPIFGVGFNAYKYAQERYGFIKEENSKPIHSAAGVSNSYLFVLATTGIIGFGLFINFWFRIIKELFSKYRGSTLADRYFCSAVIASLVGIFVHSLFENSLFYTFIMIWIFSLIGIIFGNYENKKKN